MNCKVLIEMLRGPKHTSVWIKKHNERSFTIHWNDFQTQSSRGVVIESVLEMCSKFTRERTCRSVTSTKLQRNFFEITLRHGCSPVNLLHLSRIPETVKRKINKIDYSWKNFDDIIERGIFEKFCLTPVTHSPASIDQSNQN